MEGSLLVDLIRSLDEYGTYCYLMSGESKLRQKDIPQVLRCWARGQFCSSAGIVDAAAIVGLQKLIRFDCLLDLSVVLALLVLANTGFQSFDYKMAAEYDCVHLVEGLGACCPCFAFWLAAPCYRRVVETHG